MSPSYLLAALPPPALAVRIAAFREAHALRDAAATPHITVKARSGLAPDLGWADAARAAVAAYPPVRVQVGGPAVFRNGTALYLGVQSPDVVGLHLALLAALRPAQRFGYEGPHMTPHLSVALARRGTDLSALLASARVAFADLEAGPLAFTVHEVALLRKAGPGGVYLPAGSWPLGEDRER
ncbi:2'-5' RNA ligase family protein [uncultured Deinococcus sp.]|uniref:2'-5' RNA ligase family protein n=1 Tax=uncultured Deinococcus sp. TaxID=158789 RepID=UPI0025835AE2|nr:2'-5' RNA ligase family protein [uncultured Deinococcus sp.]